MPINQQCKPALKGVYKAALVDHRLGYSGVGGIKCWLKWKILDHPYEGVQFESTVSFNTRRSIYVLPIIFSKLRDVDPYLELDFSSYHGSVCRIRIETVYPGIYGSNYTAKYFYSINEDTEGVSNSGINHQKKGACMQYGNNQ